MPAILQKLFTTIIGKKRLIGWVSAALIAVAATFLGMDSKTLKEAVCDAPIVNLPAPEVPAAVVPEVK